MKQRKQSMRELRDTAIVQRREEKQPPPRSNEPKPQYFRGALVKPRAYTPIA